jgi:hypothetical protein
MKFNNIHVTTYYYFYPFFVASSILNEMAQQLLQRYNQLIAAEQRAIDEKAEAAKSFWRQIQQLQKTLSELKNDLYFYSLHILEEVKYHQSELACLQQQYRLAKSDYEEALRQRQSRIRELEIERAAIQTFLEFPLQARQFERQKQNEAVNTEVWLHYTQKIMEQRELIYEYGRRYVLHQRKLADLRHASLSRSAFIAFRDEMLRDQRNLTTELHTVVQEALQYIAAQQKKLELKRQLQAAEQTRRREEAKNLRSELRNTAATRKIKFVYNKIQ